MTTITPPGYKGTPSDIARRRLYARLAKTDMTIEEIAERLGVQPRSAAIMIYGMGLRPRPPARNHKADPDELAWALAVLAEGLPLTWVAESVSIPLDQIKRRWYDTHDDPPPSSTEFRKVWPRICLTPELRALHEEFAPVKKRH